MADEIVLQSPIDAHVHLRQGDLLRRVAPLVERWRERYGSCA